MGLWGRHRVPTTGSLCLWGHPPVDDHHHLGLCSHTPWLWGQEVAVPLSLPSITTQSWGPTTGRRQEARTKYFDKGHLGAAEIKSFPAWSPA